MQFSVFSTPLAHNAQSDPAPNDWVARYRISNDRTCQKDT